MASKSKKEITKEKLITGWTPPASTIVIKNVFEKIPDIALNSINEDMIVASIIGGYGTAYYQSSISHAVYREHKNNLWSGQVLKNKNLMSTYRTIRKLNSERGYDIESERCKRAYIKSKICYYTKLNRNTKIAINLICFIGYVYKNDLIYEEANSIKKYLRWFTSSILKKTCRSLLFTYILK